jgi:hypothetical protein
MNWLKDFFFCNTWRELFSPQLWGDGIHRVLGVAGVCVCDVRIVCYTV